MFEQLSKLGKQIGGDLNKALQVPLKADNWSIASRSSATTPDLTNLLTPASLVAEHSAEKEAVLQGLEAKYYQQDFEPLLHELQTFPGTLDTQALEDIAEARTGVLEVVMQDNLVTTLLKQERGMCLCFRLSASSCHDMCCSTMTSLWKA